MRNEKTRPSWKTIERVCDAQYSENITILIVSDFAFASAKKSRKIMIVPHYNDLISTPNITQSKKMKEKNIPNESDMLFKSDKMNGHFI